MANKWKGVITGPTFNNFLTPLVDLIIETNKAEDAILKATKTGLEAAKAFAALVSIDPLEEALRLLLAEVTALIDQLAENTTCHGIFIPIQKNYPGFGPFARPGAQVDNLAYTPKFDELLKDGSYEEQLVSSITPETISFINTAPGASGGNAGFWSTLFRSTLDVNDPARPRFDSTFAVSGVAIVFGSAQLSALNRITAALEALFRFGILSSDMTARTRPVVQNLRAIPVPTLAKKDSNNPARIGVQLDWDPVPPLKINSLYDASASFIVDEIIIVRSTLPRAREAFRWHDLFLREPSNDITDLDFQGSTRVIARLKNYGFIRRYIDDDPSLTEGVTYYYTIALRYFSQEEGASGTDAVKIRQPMGPFCSMQRVFYNGRTGATRRSNPPDWFALPSLVTAFPPIKDALGTAKLWLAGLIPYSTTNNGFVNILQQLINQIDRLRAQLQRVVDEMKRIIELLKILRDGSLAVVTSTSFNVKRGGMDGWMAELARRLSDPSDPSRPPFDANELVAGIVIVAGAPNFARLEAFDRLKAIFFGGDDTPIQYVIDVLGEPPASRRGATREVVEDDDLLSAKEDPVKVYFDPAFVPSFVPTSTPPDDPDTFFDDDMNPVATPNC